MKSKDGAVIIGCTHSGVENADRVISELKKDGIKEGDLLAFEMPQRQADANMRQIERTGVIRLLPKMMALAKVWELVPKDAELPPEMQYERELVIRVKEQLLFQQVLFEYFVKNKIRVLGFGSFPVNERIRRMLEKVKKSGFEGTLTKKQGLLVGLAMGPLQEKFWKKRLKGKKPRFGVCGLEHLPAVKRIVAYRKATRITKAPLKERIARRSRWTFARLLYRTRKEARKARKRMRRK